MAAPAEDPARKRILTHMNKDHIYDTKLYLIHRLGYPTTLLQPSNPTQVLLSDIQNTHLTISVDGTTKEIPFKPPMASLADSRVRLVEMTRAAEAATGLDRDIIDIKPVYILPQTGQQWIMLIGLLGVLYMLLFPATLREGGAYREYLLGNKKELADWMADNTWWGLTMFTSIHAAEAVWFWWAKLRPLSVVPGVDLVTQALYMIDVALEGAGGIARWETMLKLQKEAKKKAGKKDH